MICLDIHRRKERTFSTAHTYLVLMTACYICFSELSICYVRFISLSPSILTTSESREYISQWYIWLMSSNKTNSMGNNFKVIVKTLQIHFSKVYLKETTKTILGDTHLVIYSAKNWKNICDIGYKYNLNKVIILFLLLGQDFICLKICTRIIGAITMVMFVFVFPLALI